MEIAVHGRHVELTDKVRGTATSKVQALAKYLNGMERAEVLFHNGKKGHLADPVTCELTMVGHGHVVRAQGLASSPDAALEVAVDKAALRLTKLKHRLVTRSRPRHKTAKGAAGRPQETEEAEIEGIEEL